jgi:hypothetical protein
MKTDKQTLIDVIRILEKEVQGYSKEFLPERIVRINEYVEKLKKNLGP